MTPLLRTWLAAVQGDTVRVRDELNNGFNIESVGPDDGTLLQSAIRFSFMRFEINEIPPKNDMVILLLENGADPNSQDNRGRAAIHECSAGGNLDHLILLVQYNADLNLKTLKGRTPLHLCAKQGNAEYAKYLIDHGADINSLDNDHRTPLIAAVAAKYTPQGNREMVKCLIEKGANMMLVGANGHTAQSLSINLGRDDITEVIQAAIMIRENCVAFASGHHKRLGLGSDVNSLQPEIMRMILDIVLEE